jgi:hypothetical protein
MQPVIRTKATHDPSSMEGQAYLPTCLLFEFTTSGSGHSDFYTVPANTWLEDAMVVIDEALDGSGTVNLGTDGSASALVASSELTEASAGSCAHSRQTTAPDGIYFTAVDLLRLTVGGVPTEGKVRVILKLWYLDQMADQGFHDEVEIGA